MKQVGGFTFKTIWLTMLLAAFSCTVIVLGWATAEWRVRHAEQEMRANFLRKAVEVASSINPHHLSVLSFDRSDQQRRSYGLIRDQFRAFSSDVPALSAIYGLTVRDDNLVYGPSFVVGDAPVPLPGVAYDASEADWKQKIVSGRRFVANPTPDSFSAVAPVFDPNVNEVLMAVVLEMPTERWREQLQRIRFVPMAIALLLLTLQFAGIGALYLRCRFAPKRYRHLETIFVAGFFLLLTGAATFFVLEAENRNLCLQFMFLAESRAEALEANLRNIQHKMAHISECIETSASLTGDAFHAFSASLLSEPAIESCFWITKMPDQERPHEEDTEYQVYRLNSAGQQIIVVEDDEIEYPVYYVSSSTGGLVAPGLDMGSLHEEKVAITTSAQTRQITASTPARERTFDAQGQTVHLYAPVYADNDSSPEALRGFVGAALRFDRLLSYAQGSTVQQSEHASMTFFQVVADETPLSLAYDSGSGYNPPPAVWGFATLRDVDLSFMHPMFILSHTYALLIEPTQSFLAAHPMRNVYATALVSFFITVALTLFVGILRNQQAAMELKIQESTLELRERGETFRRLFTESTDPILLLEKGKIVDCNSSTLRLLRYKSRQQLLHQRPENISPPTQPDGRPSEEAFKEMVALCVRNGHHAFEWTHLKANGAPVPVEVMFTLITIRGVNHIHATWRDITERKRAEEALRSSEEKYRSLVDSLPIGLYRYTLAPEERFVMVNKAMVKIHGSSNEKELMALNVKDLYADPVEREALWRELEEKDYVAEREVRIKRKDGAIIWGSISGRMLRNAAGNIEYFDGSVIDVTERKIATEERMEMERRLLHSQKLESLGVLAGGIAHDFNNLLAVVLGNLEIAAEEIRETPAAHESVNKAVTAARRAAALTDQMLAYSGKGSFVVKPLDLSVEIQENLEILRASISKDVSVELHLQENLPPIYADEGQIQQIVMNLISNASEAIGENEGKITIGTGVTHYTAEDLQRCMIEDKPAPGDFIFLDVSDTGCGMDAATLHRVFDPFYSTKFTGRGLGMSAVHGIVQGHHGALEITSAVGAGATVRVLFPVATKPPEEMPAAKTYEPETSAPAQKSREQDNWTGTFLVVDDEAPLRELGQKALNRFGFDTIVACDGQEAVEIFEQKADEIVGVLLDLTMPRMDGASAFAAMRKIKPDVKVILCSGFSENEAMQHFPGQTLAGYVHKPYRLTALRAEIEKVMEDERSVS